MSEINETDPPAEALVSGSPSAAVRVEADPTDPLKVKVVIDGELDLASAGALKDVLLGELSQGRDVVLDLSAVSFIDSTGLAAVVGAVNHAKRVNRSLLVLRTIQPQPLRLMELTQVLPTLDLTDQ